MTTPLQSQYTAILYIKTVKKIAYNDMQLSYVLLCVCVCVRVYVHVCVCVCVYVCLYTLISSVLLAQDNAGHIIKGREWAVIV